MREDGSLNPKFVNSLTLHGFFAIETSVEVNGLSRSGTRHQWKAFGRFAYQRVVLWRIRRLSCGELKRAVGLQAVSCRPCEPQSEKGFVP
jgi:hypothetical protein